MKVSREQVQRHRERILAAAGQLFRERGFDDVTVAEIMKAAGLTHGAFYGYFDSKEALIGAALAHASESLQRVLSLPTPAFVDYYLSTQHRDDRGHGCPIAGLGTEAARAPDEVRAGLSSGIRRQIDRLSSASPGTTPAERRQAGIAAYASMVGAMVLARLVDDEPLSKEILSATRASIDVG